MKKLLLVGFIDWIANECRFVYQILCGLEPVMAKAITGVQPAISTKKELESIQFIFMAEDL